MNRLYSILNRDFYKKDMASQCGDPEQVASFSMKILKILLTLDVAATYIIWILYLYIHFNFQDSIGGSNGSVNGKKLESPLIKGKFNQKTFERNLMNTEEFVIERSPYDSFLNDHSMTNLEKLHFIIGHGILRPDLRYSTYYYSLLIILLEAIVNESLFTRSLRV